MNKLNDSRLISSDAQSTSSFGNALAFMLPILGLIQFELVGQVFVHELILLILFVPLFLRRGNYFTKSGGMIIFLFVCIWLAAQIFTDFVRNSPPEDYFRGWAKISFFMIGFVSLSCLLVNEKRALWWVTASVIPLFYRPFLLFSHDLDPLVLWKFGVGPALLLFCCLPFIWLLHRKPLGGSGFKAIANLHFAFGVLSFFLNARSFAALSILTGILILIYAKRRGGVISAASLAIASVAVLIVVNILALAYSYGASSGMFGAEAQEKYESQVMYGGGLINMLLGGRSEGLVSTQAIADSPIIGHGSWAKNFKYSMMLADLRRNFSEVNEGAVTDDTMDGLIPSHSYLLGAWVEAGIVGGAFWLFIILWMLFRVLPAAWLSGDVVGLFVVMSLPLFFWNVLFSPFGANVRVEVAGFLAICIFVIYKAKMRV